MTSLSRLAGRSPRARRLILFVGVVAASSAPGPARADRIFLRGGGQIRGKLVDEADKPGKWVYIGETGKQPIVYRKEQVLRVIAESGPLDDYVSLRAKPRSSAAQEHELGAWCADRGLADLASNHFEAALKLDPKFAPAHERLGHTLVDDRWLDADELKEARGMVKYKGRWLTPEDRDRLEGEATSTAEAKSWARRIRQIRDAYVGGPEARSREAEVRLLGLREPFLVGPIVQVLGSDPVPAVRSLGVRALGTIEGAEATSAIVGRLLADTDGSVRDAAIAEAARRNLDDVLPKLYRALQSTQPEVINRAAWSLARLDDRSAVPRLVRSLVTVEYRPMLVDPGGGGGSPGGVSFNSVAPSGGPGFANYSGGTFAALTPPVVGPGVVAFGVTGVPYSALGNGYGGGGVSIGGGGGGGGGISLGGGGSRGPVPTMVPITHQNVEVLSALNKMTGQDFGYDASTWNRWITSSFKIDRAPGRRVLSP